MNKHTAQETPAMDAHYTAFELAQGRGDVATTPATQTRYFASGESMSPEQNAALDWLTTYAGNFDFLVDMKLRFASGKPMSEKMVDAIVRCRARDLDHRPAVVQINSTPVTAAGFYEHAGRIYKVQVAVHGSGRLYAKVLEIDEANSKGSFVYAPGVVGQLSADEVLTQERARELGHLYGMCCICGATLTDERSIEAGIGPICAGKV